MKLIVGRDKSNKVKDEEDTKCLYDLLNKYKFYFQTQKLMQ